MNLTGVWLPLITPFHNDKIDFSSYKMLINHYCEKNISGIMPLATTGECPVLSEYEFETLIDKTIEYTANRLPIYIGLGSNNTAKIIQQLSIVEKYPVEGILSVVPYYNKPDQRGMYEHFSKISEATKLKIILYNIPHRTGVNMENNTIHKLAEKRNIVGIKDSCGNFQQSMELLLNAPDNFSIFTGEDIFYYTNLSLGGQGGILASAHIHTEKFIHIYSLMKENKQKHALEEWKKLAAFIPLLFQEPNPAPLKYCLQKQGLITSAETRLPLVEITKKLQQELDKYI